MMRRVIALAYGLVCHATFGVAVAWMAVGLATGMGVGFGGLEGYGAVVTNLALALQFPFVHSFLLSRRGRHLLGRLAPQGLRRTVGTTLYAWAASAQVLLVFACWSPSGVIWFRPTGAAAAGVWAAYAASWLLLGKAMRDAGLGVQTGSLGWVAAFRGRDPVYPPMPTRGLFASWRQPIYTAFAAILVTAPVWTPDRLLVAVVWGGYCLVGPVLKERRYAVMYGDAFARYRRTHPYWLPLGRRRRACGLDPSTART